jgi:hypothetical protein
MKDLMENKLNESIGKRETVVGTNAMVLGELHGQPPFHALTLNDDNLRGQGG